RLLVGAARVVVGALRLAVELDAVVAELVRRRGRRDLVLGERADVDLPVGLAAGRELAVPRQRRVRPRDLVALLVVRVAVDREERDRLRAEVVGLVVRPALVAPLVEHAELHRLERRLVGRRDRPWRRLGGQRRQRAARALGRLVALVAVALLLAA